MEKRTIKTQQKKSENAKQKKPHKASNGMEFLDTDYACSIIVYDIVSSSLNQNAPG